MLPLNMKRRVGMLLKRGKSEAVDIASQLAPWLKANGHEAFIVRNDEHEPEVPAATLVAGEELVDKIDLLMVLGGDGTLLHGAALVAERGVPILGINLGHLGFLTSCAPADAQVALERALRGELVLEERMRLCCRITRQNGEQMVKFACNDAVVSQGAQARLIELEAFLDGNIITRYRADGLIICTPTGSTAYNLAAGGPIVAPDVRAVVVTPICPHTLTNRPLVAPASSDLRIRLGGDASHVLVTIDGQWATNLLPGDYVDIGQASPPLYLYRPSESYFDVLRHKLAWGELG
jgi:NAD+ kinase